MYGGVYYDSDSAAKSRELGTAIKSLADKAGCSFFDASTVSSAGNDGIHFSENAHMALADALNKKIHELVSSSSKR